MAMSSPRVGRPGVLPGTKAGLEREDLAVVSGESVAGAVVKAVRRLERSERGWPIVDISQLRASLMGADFSTLRMDFFFVCAGWLLGETQGGRRYALENTDNPRLGLVEYQVVNLEITMHQRGSVGRLSLRVSKVRHKFLHVRQGADESSRVDITDG